MKINHIFFVIKGHLYFQYVNIVFQSIKRLFAYCKGGNFNIHIWAWFGYFISQTKDIMFNL